MAELATWDAAFEQLAEATGEQDVDKMVARFLAADEENYGLFTEAALAAEEVEAAEASLAAVEADTQAALDRTVAARKAAIEEARSKLHEVEASADEAAERERVLLAQLNAVAAKLAGLYKRLKYVHL
jgi:hypothetical protein